jgi:hypothetical protein
VREVQDFAYGRRPAFPSLQIAAHGHAADSLLEGVETVRVRRRIWLRDSGRRPVRSRRDVRKIEGRQQRQRLTLAAPGAATPVPPALLQEPDSRLDERRRGFIVLPELRRGGRRRRRGRDVSTRRGMRITWLLHDLAVHVRPSVVAVPGCTRWRMSASGSSAVDGHAA